MILETDTDNFRNNDRIQKMKDRFQTLCNRIEAGFSTLDTEDGLSEIDGAILEERKGSTQTTLRYTGRCCKLKASTR